MFELFVPRLADLAWVAALERIWDLRTAVAVGQTEEITVETKTKRFFEDCLLDPDHLQLLLRRSDSRSLISKVARTLAPVQGVVLADHLLGGKIGTLSTPLANWCSALCSLHAKVLERTDLGPLFSWTTKVEEEEELAAKVRGSVANKLSREHPLLRDYLSRRSETIRHYAWTLRSLLMRGYRAEEEVARFLELAETERELLVGEVAKVVSDDQDYSRENHHRVLPFYRQRFFQLTVPRLLELHSNSGCGKGVFLEAVVAQLPHVPSSVARTALPRLLPTFTGTAASDRGKVAPVFLAFLKEADPESDAWEGMVPFLLEVAASSSTPRIEDRSAASAEQAEENSLLASGLIGS